MTFYDSKTDQIKRAVDYYSMKKNETRYVIRTYYGYKRVGYNEAKKSGGWKITKTWYGPDIEEIAAQQEQTLDLFKLFNTREESKSEEDNTATMVVSNRFHNLTSKEEEETEEDFALNFLGKIVTYQIFMQHGFEFASDENKLGMLKKLQNIKCTGDTAMRDAVSLGIMTMLKLKDEMNKIDCLDYRFIHVVLTDGEDNSSETTQKEIKQLIRLLESVFEDEFCKTFFIGVGLGNSTKRKLNDIASVSDENIKVYNCKNVEIEDVFSRIEIDVGIVSKNVFLGYGNNQLMLTKNELGLKVSNDKKLLVLFTLDISGSMRGNNWRRTRAAVKQFLSKLDKLDLFGVLVFNDKVKLISG